MANVKELRRLLAERASPGPWTVANDFGRRSIRQVGREYDLHGVAGHYGVEDERDANLIIAAVNALPDLLDELEAWRTAGGSSQSRPNLIMDMVVEMEKQTR